MEFVLLSTLVSKTFRLRTKELFFGYEEAFSNPEEKMLEAARKAGKDAADALRKHLKKIKDAAKDENDDDAKELKEKADAEAADAEAKAKEAKAKEAKEAKDAMENELKELKLKNPVQGAGTTTTTTTTSKETFEDKQSVKLEPMSKTTRILLICFLVLSAVVGSYAAWLSWKANTVFELSTPWKIVFAIFAFIGGVTYLISYAVYRWKETEYTKKLKARGEALPVPIVESTVEPEPVPAVLDAEASVETESPESLPVESTSTDIAEEVNEPTPNYTTLENEFFKKAQHGGKGRKIKGSSGVKKVPKGKGKTLKRK